MEEFKKAGIDIHNPRYGAWWEAGDHMRKWKVYNDDWKKFFGPPGSPIRSRQAIIDFGREMSGNYGFRIYF